VPSVMSIFGFTRSGLGGKAASGLAPASGHREIGPASPKSADERHMRSCWLQAHNTDKTRRTASVSYVFQSLIGGSGLKFFPGRDRGKF
jgi:hypothetical protein